MSSDYGLLQNSKLPQWLLSWPWSKVNCSCENTLTNFWRTLTLRSREPEKLLENTLEIKISIWSQKMNMNYELNVWTKRITENWWIKMNNICWDTTFFKFSKPFSDDLPFVGFVAVGFWRTMENYRINCNITSIEILAWFLGDMYTQRDIILNIVKGCLRIPNHKKLRWDRKLAVKSSRTSPPIDSRYSHLGVPDMYRVLIC